MQILFIIYKDQMGAVDVMWEVLDGCVEWFNRVTEGPFIWAVNWVMGCEPTSDV